MTIGFGEADGVRCEVHPLGERAHVSQGKD
jgi:hypothetical protein